MKRLFIWRWAGMLALCVAPIAAVPQETALNGLQYWPAETFRSEAKELATKANGDQHRAATQKLGEFPNEYFLLAHREANGLAEWHGTEADVFVVQSGEAILVVGGTIPGASDTAAHEKRGDAITGGVRQKLTKGDVVRIPAKTAHQLLVESGKEFTYFVVKVKGY